MASNKQEISNRTPLDSLYTTIDYSSVSALKLSLKIDFVAQAKTMSYEIVLVFIHLDLVSLNQARVAQRVSEGGFSVPDE